KTIARSGPGCGAAPVKRTSPSSGSIRPFMRRSRVVLPQPLGPTRLTNSPGATSKLMSSRARTLPSTKDLPTCLKEMSGSVNVDVRSLRQAPSANPFLGIAQGADDQRCEDHEHDDHREILVHLEA